MSLRPINWLAVLVVGLCLAAGAPIQATAETFMVVVNANNRVSGSDAELRDLVRRVYLKQETQWPSGLYSLPFARPAEDATTAAFAEAVLGMTPEALDAYWADQGKTPPKAFASARELFRQISRNKGAVSVVARSEAEKLPAKVRVLFEFSPSFTPGEALAGSIDGLWLLEIQSDNPSGEPYRQVVEIVDNSFSAEVTISDSDNVWQGTLTGGVDENGRLTGSGTLEQEGGVHGALQFIQFSTPETDGRFETKILSRLILITDPGHRYSAMKLSIRLTPQPPEASTAAAFDGEWLFEITDMDKPSSTEQQSVRIVDNRFSVEVSVNQWRGTVSGEIDSSGTLVGSGTMNKSMGAWVPRVLKFSIPVTDGRFETTTPTAGGDTLISFAIKLTPQPSVAALPPPDEAPPGEALPSGAGSLDGEWVGRGEAWSATLRISGRRFDLDASCVGSSVEALVRTGGTLNEDGSIKVVRGFGSSKRIEVYGTIPELNFRPGPYYVGCHEALTLERVGAPAEVAALPPPDDAPPSGAGSFDGEWIGRQGPWSATARISGRNFDLEAKCEGTGYPIKGSVKGTLDEDGRINAVLSPGSFRRTDIFGTFPQLQFFSNHSGCQEVLVFKRAEAG